MSPVDTRFPWGARNALRANAVMPCPPRGPGVGLGMRWTGHQPQTPRRGQLKKTVDGAPENRPHAGAFAIGYFGWEEGWEGEAGPLAVGVGHGRVGRFHGVGSLGRDDRQAARPGGGFTLLWSFYIQSLQLRFLELSTAARQPRRTSLQLSCKRKREGACGRPLRLFSVLLQLLCCVATRDDHVGARIVLVQCCLSAS